ncbi:hypothetical protein CHRYSEO8AT_480023 [Chryseobacterium sp. 8AT]|nr:hypothetical protein CHRYSEO8AT_480023 [Chryseobacterium sp. 8AT]
MYLSPDSNWDFTKFKTVFSANWNREAILYGKRESNPQYLEPKSSASANSAIPASFYEE